MQTDRLRPGRWRRETIDASLNDLLSDHAVTVLMRADRLTADQVRALLRQAAQTSGGFATGGVSGRNTGG